MNCSLPSAPTKKLFQGPSVFFFLLFFIALIPRVLCLWQVQHSVLVDYLPLDAASYDRWGYLLSQGGTGDETFPGLPFYAHFLGGLYRTFGCDRQLSLEALINGQTGGEAEVSEYGIRGRWAQPVYKDWLLGEVILGYFWPRKDFQTERGQAWAIGAGLLMRF